MTRPPPGLRLELTRPQFVRSWPTWAADMTARSPRGRAVRGEVRRGGGLADNRAMHPLRAAPPETPPPAVMQAGQLFDDAGGGWVWPYLVTKRLGGRALRDAEAPQDELVDIA